MKPTLKIMTLIMKKLISEMLLQLRLFSSVLVSSCIRKKWRFCGAVRTNGCFSYVCVWGFVMTVSTSYPIYILVINEFCY